MNSWKMQNSLKIKKIMKKNEIITILFINLHVYKKFNDLMSDWTLHFMNNNIVYKKSFNSTKQTSVSRELNNVMIENQRFY